MITIFSQPLLYTLIFTKTDQMTVCCPSLRHFEQSREISRPDEAYTMWE